MTVTPFPGVDRFPTHHCITGSLRHIYDWAGYEISEDMLLGLGSGVGFSYWHFKGADPFYGGRANMERPGVEGLEKTVGRRTGVAVETFRTSSRRKAETAMLESFAAKEPLMVYLDMGFLGYLGLPDDYHFGAHCVALVGFDEDTGTVLVADRDPDLHPVSLDELEQARGSRYKPFPPQHQWFAFDFSSRRQPTESELWESIRDAATGMLEPPISNIGVKGIHKAARETAKWPKLMAPDDLRRCCFNAAIFIDATGGTGGGIFRYMYSRYLDEVAARTGQGQLSKVAVGFGEVGDRWEEVAAMFHRGAEATDPAVHIDQVVAVLPEISATEEALWTELASLAG